MDFVHFNGMSGELYFVENVGSGLALLDYDNDGDLDLYLVQGNMLGPGKTLADATFPPRSPLVDQLYRNDVDPAGGFHFVPVTERSGITGDDYGMGVATGDIDGDGFVDLYVTAFGKNRMWHNDGDGTFTDVTEATGTQDDRWSVSATFLDYDNDGWLDLYVGNYMDFSFATQKVCRSETGARDYCHPLAFDPQTDRLFHNRGDGTFEDVSEASGITRVFGGALGVVATDFDGDGWADVYVANDMLPNQLWMNQRDGTFEDDALLGGCAVNAEGRPEASMGIDVADFDGDGDEDLFMTHLNDQSNTLYLNDGHGNFRDGTRESGLGAPSWNFTGFGTSFVDYDLDGDLDLLAVNGSVRILEALASQGDPYPLHQRNQLFENLGGGRFREIEDPGPPFEVSEVSRGAAFGDLDQDGDTDVAISNNMGPARVLRNDEGDTSRPWIGVRALLPGPGFRDALGTRTAVITADGPIRWRRVKTSGSFASAGDPRVVTALAGLEPLGILIRWPDGRRVAWRGAPAHHYLLVRLPSAGGA